VEAAEIAVFKYVVSGVSRTDGLIERWMLTAEIFSARRDFERERHFDARAANQHLIRAGARDDGRVAAGQTERRFSFARRSSYSDLFMRTSLQKISSLSS